MEKMNNLRDLLKHELEDLRSAEDQITAALPKMIENAKNAKLKQSLQQHLRVTEQQIRRLDRIDEMMKGSGGENEGGEKKGFLGGLFGGGTHHCKGMEGIISEGEKIVKEDMDPDVKDAAIIASSQKIEHYEICGYGTARAFARELGLRDVERLLTETLNEEYEADDLLTNLAVVGGLNEEAKARRNRRSTSGQGNSAGKKSKSASKSSGGRSKTASKGSKSASKSSGGRSKAASKGSKSASKSSGGRSKAASKGSKSASKSSGRSKAASKGGSKSASRGGAAKSSGRSKAASKGGSKSASKGRSKAASRGRR